MRASANMSNQYGDPFQRQSAGNAIMNCSIRMAVENFITFVTPASGGPRMSLKVISHNCLVYEPSSVNGMLPCL
jgi:hypothetical protein